jgi:hypothetical protein
VSYLPFAYAPTVHFPEAPLDARELEAFDADVAFAGGADRDRLPVVSALMASGLRVALYGGYWDRYPGTKSAARGHLGPAGLRKAASAARVSICLVRHANRDGHAMRSYEGPAMRSCLLVEDTEDHRRLFGDHDSAVAYFRTAGEAVSEARRLVANASLCEALRDRAHAVVTEGRHTYADRLASMLETGVSA